MNDIRLFIDGEFSNGSAGAPFDDVNPATGQVHARVHKASREDVDAAVQAARRALSGPWGKMSGRERRALMFRIADEIDRRRDDFMRAEIADTGKPAALAGSIDIPRGAANFRAFADLCDHPSESYSTPTPDGRGAINTVVRSPKGVISVICPWNLPLLLMTWKVAPALATGNTVVVKPSEETPATATLLGEVMNEVGVPAGVYNVIHGFGPADAGQFLVQHEGVDAITFTGESRTGSAIMKDAASRLKPISFELGGKNPSLVFADCDLDAAVAGTVRSVFANCGQVCLCSERVYVERSVFDEFTDRLVDATRGLVLGDPHGPDTNTGPLISAEHQKKVLSYFELAQQEGAEVRTGGQKAELPGAFGQGFFVEPTIWTGLPDTARTVREEIFGPCCHIAPFDDEDEVVARANDTDYGLCAAVWTRDVSRAYRVPQALDVGIVWVNDWFLRDLRTPFGGTKTSGIGREGGKYSLEFYTELKNICIKL